MARRQGSWMLLLACCLLAQALPSRPQPQFQFAETTPGAYDYLSMVHPRSVLWLHASPKAKNMAGEYGALVYTVRAAEVVGNASLARVRMRAQVRWEKVLGSSAWAGLFVRVDGDWGFVLALDNMRDRPLTGSSSSSGSGSDQESGVERTVVLDVPRDAWMIRAGVFLCGGFGQVWMHDFHLEQVGEEVGVTGGPPPWAGPLSLVLAPPGM